MKILSMILALLMISGSLAACSNNPGVESDEHTAGNPSESGDIDISEETYPEGYDSDGFIKDELPELNFNGQKVSILYWSDVEKPEFDVEEVTGEIVNDAIHQRNLSVEDRLNIDYVWTGTRGDGSDENINNYVQTVRESVMAGDGAYDILAAYSRTIAACTANSLTLNIEDSKYIDFEKPWWPQTLVEESLINDKLYFISGDISTNMLHMMYATFCNDSLIDEHQLEDPAQLVLEGKWTLDKMIEFTGETYRDLNGNGTKDADDFFGLTLCSYHNDAFYTGSGLKLLEKDPDTMVKVSDDFYGEKVVSLLEKLGEYEQTKDVYNAEDYYHKIFAENRAIFTINRAYYAENYLRDSNVQYSILPIPKYDEAQQEHKTVLGNPITLYSVSRDSRIGDVSHAVLECMASYAYRLTTPAVFENNMKKKYSNDDIDAQMFDIIRDSVVFELGRFYNKYLNNITDIFYNAVMNNDQTWASKVQARKKLMNIHLKSLTAALVEAESTLGQ